MITSELKLNKRGNIDSFQRCQIKCDQCNKDFERVYCDILTSREKYENKDLCLKCSWPLGKPRPTFTEYNKNCKGLTLEQRLGEEKAQQTKQKMSEKNKGEKHPNYGGKYSRFEGAIKWNQDNLKGKTLEDAYGFEKAQKIKAKIGEHSKGENNPMFGKASPLGAGNGWKGYYKNIYFRSILELKYLKYLLDNNIIFENGEKAKYRIPYILWDGTNRTYATDYYLPETNVFIELKPKKLIDTPTNKLKFEAARELLGDRHIILTENDVQLFPLEEMYELYLSEDLIWDKNYVDKFLNYYEKNK